MPGGGRFGGLFTLHGPARPGRVGRMESESACVVCRVSCVVCRVSSVVCRVCFRTCVAQRPHQCACLIRVTLLGLSLSLCPVYSVLTPNHPK